MWVNIDIMHHNENVLSCKHNIFANICTMLDQGRNVLQMLYKCPAREGGGGNISRGEE